MSSSIRTGAQGKHAHGGGSFIVCNLLLFVHAQVSPVHWFLCAGESRQRVTGLGPVPAAAAALATHDDSDTTSDIAEDTESTESDAGDGNVATRLTQRTRRPIASSRLQRQLYKTRSPCTPSWAEKVRMDEDIPKV